MTGLTVLSGGGEHARPPRQCGICGAAHRGACPLLARHLDHRRLKGHTPATAYCIQRAIVRLAKWLTDPRNYATAGARVTGDPVCVVDPPDLRDYATVTGAPVCVADATAASLARWQASLDMTPGVVASYTSHARSFYAWLVYEDYRADNPAAKLPMPRLGRRLPRPIGAGDLFRALEAAPPRIRPWLILAAFCGLRCREVALLRRECLMETSAPPVLLVAAEAAKGRRERIVPLSGYVTSEIRTWKLPSEGFCFRRVDGQAGPNAPWLVSHLSNDFLHSLGIGATLHQLRHYFGSEAYRAGRDLRATQELLGHASPVTTAAYAAYSNASAIEAVEAIPHPGRLHAVQDTGTERSS